ncbi:MAG: hypothetical protein U0939_20110 [Pirellulales bacterium]
MFDTTRPMTDSSFLKRPLPPARTSQSPGAERRQFASNYETLSPAGRELALAIDQYKLEHHRKFVNHDEMLQVILALGYRKVESK